MDNSGSDTLNMRVSTVLAVLCAAGMAYEAHAGNTNGTFVLLAGWIFYALTAQMYRIQRRIRLLDWTIRHTSRGR